MTGENQSRGDATVAFLDLVRFTSLTDVHGDETAVDLVERFLGVVAGARAGSTEVVKTLGDGVLLRADGPDDLLACAAVSVRRWHDERAVPDVRGGLHHGPVTIVAGDVFGATVNIASRLADAARPGSLALTRPVAEAATALGIAVQPLGPRLLRGVMDPMEVFLVEFDRRSGSVVDDPVCGMRLEPGPDTPSRSYLSRTYYFCGSECAGFFERSPARFV